MKRFTNPLPPDNEQECSPEDIAATQHTRKTFLLLLDIWLTCVSPFIGQKIAKRQRHAHTSQLHIMRALLKVRPYAVPESEEMLAGAAKVLDSCNPEGPHDEGRKAAAKLAPWITRELALLP